MGNLLCIVRKVLSNPSEQRKIMLVGLDGAGKTTFLYKLKLGDLITTIPMIGLYVDTLDYKNIHITTWDSGGEDKIRAVQNLYQDKTDIIFFVDSNDRDRIQNAKEELFNILKVECLEGLPLLIFANKQNLPNAMTKEEIEQLFELESLNNRQWFVQPSIATTGEGLFEGLDWLSSASPIVSPQRFQQTKSARK